MASIGEIAAYFIRKEPPSGESPELPLNQGVRMKNCMPGGRNCEIYVKPDGLVMTGIPNLVHGAQLSGGWIISNVLGIDIPSAATLMTQLEIGKEQLTVDLPAGTSLIAADIDNSRLQIYVDKDRLYKTRWPGGKRGKYTKATKEVRLSGGGVIKLNNKI